MTRKSKAEELFDLIYAHTVVKYDPTAGIRCIEAAFAHLPAVPDDHMIDMANVGEALMEAIRDYSGAEFMKTWAPADCPSEIVGDLLNALEEATPPASEADRDVTVGGWPRLTDAMIRAACAAHFGKAAYDMVDGLDITAGGTNWTFRQFMKRIWPALKGAALSTTAAQSAEGRDTEVSFEIWQDDMMVASSTSESDARHYLAVYSQDGPAALVRAETTRTALAGHEEG